MLDEIASIVKEKSNRFKNNLTCELSEDCLLEGGIMFEKGSEAESLRILDSISKLPDVSKIGLQKVSNLLQHKKIIYNYAEGYYLNATKKSIRFVLPTNIFVPILEEICKSTNKEFRLTLDASWSSFSTDELESTLKQNEIIIKEQLFVTITNATRGRGGKRTKDAYTIAESLNFNGLFEQLIGVPTNSPVKRAKDGGKPELSKQKTIITNTYKQVLKEMIKDGVVLSKLSHEGATLYRTLLINELNELPYSQKRALASVYKTSILR